MHGTGVLRKTHLEIRLKNDVLYDDFFFFKLKIPPIIRVRTVFIPDEKTKKKKKTRKFVLVLRPLFQ